MEENQLMFKKYRSQERLWSLYMVEMSEDISQAHKAHSITNF